MIKAIIFDSDGMITPSKRFSAELEKTYGISIQTTSPFFDNILKKCLIGKADAKKELVTLIKGWGWEKSVDELMQYWFKSQSKTNPQIVEKIHELRKHGIKCYLATNQEKYRTQYMLKEMGFENLFDEVFSSAYIGLKKPETNFFEYIYQKIHAHSTEKEEIMFWDDEPKHIEAVTNFGFKALLYKNFQDFCTQIML